MRSRQIPGLQRLTNGLEGLGAVRALKELPIPVRARLSKGGECSEVLLRGS